MNNEIEKIFKDQLDKLPVEVIDYISSSEWDSDTKEIGSLYNLNEKDISLLMREVSLVLSGLIHPDEFFFALEDLGFKGEVLEDIVANVEKKIFEPIRPALIEFFEKESEENAEKIPVVATTPEPTRTWEKEADVAPENLPTDEEGESLLPPIPLMFGADKNVAPAHPFEEKMKKVFTAGQQSLGDLAIEPPSQTSPQTQSSKAPPIFHADPYREPIE